MKYKRVPNKLNFGRDSFYYSSSHNKQHDAKKFKNKLRKKGFICRIVFKKNRYHIYKGTKRKCSRRYKRKR